MYLTNKSPLHEARKELNSTLAYELVLERQTIQSMNKETSLILTNSYNKLKRITTILPTYEFCYNLRSY